MKYFLTVLTSNWHATQYLIHLKAKRRSEKRKAKKNSLVCTQNWRHKQQQQQQIINPLQCAVNCKNARHFMRSIMAPWCVFVWHFFSYKEMYVEYYLMSVCVCVCLCAKSNNKKITIKGGVQIMLEISKRCIEVGNVRSMMNKWGNKFLDDFQMGWK